MNKDRKIRELKSILEAKKIDIFELNETKIKQGRQGKMKDLMGDKWVIHTNTQHMKESEGNFIWFGWKSSI